jgi:hypothetical protein
MTSDRKQPGVAFWATVMVVTLLVAYPLSFGPACWITSHAGSMADVIPVAYRPMLYVVDAAPAPVERAVCMYAQALADDGWMLLRFPFGLRAAYGAWRWMKMPAGVI